MKKIFLCVLSIIALMMTNCTQATQTEAVPQEQQGETPQEEVATYKLYPTTNLWTFIKLDTRNGKMWQVQYSVKGDDYRFETPLNTTSLSANDDKAGRFELHPTQNMFNFILLDCIDGNTWQVQWSTNPENQAVIPISQIDNNQ